MPAQGTARTVQLPSLFGIFPSTSDRTIEMNKNLHSKQCYQRSVCQTEENCFLPSSLKWLSKHISISRQLGRKETAKSVRGKLFPTSSILLSFLSNSVPCLFSLGASRSLFSILETIWKTVFNMQMKRNVRAHQYFEELL